MSRKTKGTWIFFILIPIFLIIAAFIYDSVIKSATEKNYRKTTENIIKDVLSNSYNDKAEWVKKLYEEKNLETKQLNVTYQNDILYVYNVHTFPAFFGLVFGIKSYRTEVNLKAYKVDNEIKIEEVKERYYG